MRAALLASAPGDLEIIDDLQVDKPRSREVLIRTAAAGVCHSDLLYAQAKFRTRTPTVLGHEAAGIVEAVGDEVTQVKPGDRAITCISLFCGSCEYCLSGRPVLCVGTRMLRRGKTDPPRLSRGGGLSPSRKSLAIVGRADWVGSPPASRSPSTALICTSKSA